MTTFIWVVAVYCALETVAKIVCMAMGTLPPRTMGGAALDTVLNIGMVVWAAVLLS